MYICTCFQAPISKTPSSSCTMVRPQPDDDAPARPSFVSKYNPLRIAVSVLRRGVFSTTSLRIASHLVPFLVCVSLIPLILFFSIFSGWYIWKNIPVGWQVPVYLQYGSVSFPDLLHPLTRTAVTVPPPTPNCRCLPSPPPSHTIFLFNWSCPHLTQTLLSETLWPPYHCPRPPTRPSSP